MNICIDHTHTYTTVYSTLQYNYSTLQYTVHYSIYKCVEAAQYHISGNFHGQNFHKFKPKIKKHSQYSIGSIRMSMLADLEVIVTEQMFALSCKSVKFLTQISSNIQYKQFHHRIKHLQEFS